MTDTISKRRRTEFAVSPHSAQMFESTGANSCADSLHAAELGDRFDLFFPPEFINLRRDKTAIFVDKSMIIRELVKQPREIILAPRQFGKTLLASMIYTFYAHPFDVRGTLSKVTNVQYFKDLEIMKIEETGFVEKHMNKYPALYISFASITHRQNLEDAIIDCIKQACVPYVHLLLQSISKIEDVKVLVGAIHKKYDKRILIIIDEFDTPLNLIYNQTRPNAQIANDLYDLYNYFYTSKHFVLSVLMFGVVVVQHPFLPDNRGLFNTFDSFLTPGTYRKFFGYTYADITKFFKFSVQEIKDIWKWYGGHSYRDGTTRTLIDTCAPASVNAFHRTRSLASYSDSIDGATAFILPVLSSRKACKAYTTVLITGSKITQLERKVRLEGQEVVADTDLYSLLVSTGLMVRAPGDGSWDMYPYNSSVQYKVIIPNYEVRSYLLQHLKT